MDMNAIREYICSNDKIKALIGNNVFLFEKPEKVKATTYILYNFKELSGGARVRDYQLDVRIVGKDIHKLIKLKDILITILDNFKQPTKIKDSETIIRHTQLVNGGGIIRNEDSTEYNILLYFLIKI